MLRKISMTVAALCLSAPALAVTTEQLEVLGVHLADDLKTSEARLLAQGFKRGSNSIFSCATTYQKRMAELVKAGRERFLPTEIMCVKNFVKGTDRVQVDYLLAPRGFVVSGLDYSFRSTEASAQIEDRLAKKFGAPSDRVLGNPTWYANRRAAMQMANLQYLGRNGLHNLLMRGGSVMSDTFADEIRKDLKRRMPAMRANL